MTASSEQTKAVRTRRSAGITGVGAALLFGATLLVGSQSAHAQDATVEHNFLPGQEAAFAIEGVMMGGSLISIVGNSVDLVKGTPHKGWMWSGFILGWMNTVVSPILMIYGRDPKPELGLGLGAAQGVIGVANLAVAIVNGVRWHRLRVSEGIVPTPPPPTPPLDPNSPVPPAQTESTTPPSARLRVPEPTLAQRLLVTPVISRDSLGGTVGFLSVQSSF